MNTEMRVTLTQFLIESRRHYPHATGEFNSLLLNVALVCKRIARKVAAGALDGILGEADSVNVQGEAQKKLDVISNDLFKL